MRRTANMRVGELAEYCTDPEEAERLMKEAINWGIQQNRRTVRMIKLERLERRGGDENSLIFVQVDHFHFL